MENVKEEHKVITLNMKLNCVVCEEKNQRYVKRTKQTSPRPRAIIIRFSLRTSRYAVWKIAKNNPFMSDNKFRFAEDLSQPVNTIDQYLQKYH